jgi:hypothetical protein
MIYENFLLELAADVQLPSWDYQLVRVISDTDGSVHIFTCQRLAASRHKWHNGHV